MSLILYQCATEGLNMLLSDDGKTLQKVTNDDLENGDFKFPETVENISYSAFGNCTGLRQVTIPNSVKYIGPRLFENCYSLTQVTISNYVTRIPGFAFENCYSLTQVIIPNSVTRIQIAAFKNCRNLTHVNIPNSVKIIHIYAFDDCPNLKVIAINDRNQGDYQRILNLLPPEQQSLAKPWSDFKVAREIKQVALKSVAALNMNGLTALLLFKLLTKDGNIGGKIYKYSVNTKSFFQRLNHARQPALAIIYGYPYPDFKSSTPLPEYAERMLPRLCAKGAIKLKHKLKLDPIVAQMTMPTNKQEDDSYFQQIVKYCIKVKPTPSLSLLAYIWKCICDFFNWIIEKFSSVTNHPIKAQALA